MPNKTIYVRDEELWEKAKSLAAKEGDGLSGVISNALARFVSEAQSRDTGDNVFSILVVPEEEEEGKPQRITFTGKLIGTGTFTPQHPETFGGSATLNAYSTVGGKFVLTVTAAGDQNPCDFEAVRRLFDIWSVSFVGEFEGDEMDEWLNELRTAHGELRATDVYID